MDDQGTEAKPTIQVGDLRGSVSSLCRLVLYTMGHIELSDDELSLHLGVVQSALAGATTARSSRLTRPRTIRGGRHER